MYLRSITMRDWKAYGGEARFEFPTPSAKKNVVLIGAQNGYGKTSLLEALLFGLYGKDALPIVARATERSPEREVDKGYPAFLSRALHSQAIAEGRQSTTVELQFEDPDKEDGTLTVSRTWYFRPDGQFREEEVHIYEGAGHRPVTAPRLEEDKEDFFRGYVARRTLPAHLAQFFLFDGEQVQRLARSDMAAQVRMGIEGMLGATVLRALQQDLAAYARDRRNRVRDIGSDGALEKARSLLEEAEVQVERTAAALATLNDQSPLVQARRDQIVAKLQTLQSGNYDNIKELQRKHDFAETELARLKDELGKLLGSALALALVGNATRESAIRQLQGERALQAWHLGIQQSNAQQERFLREFLDAGPAFVPPLTNLQDETLRARIATAWGQMWHPPPEDCADTIRHHYLSDGDREALIRAFREVGTIGQSGIQDLLHEITENEAHLKRLNQQLARFGSIGPQLEQLVSELQTVTAELAEMTERKRAFERDAATLQSDLAAKKSSYQRLSAKFSSAQPDLQRIELAERIAHALPDLLDDANASWADRIAELMTDSFRSIAHKKVLSRVEIDPDCTVRLLTKSGGDLRSLDASAGEDQVFSFALISAIASAADVRFPIVIDTPLARLDSQHRTNILRHFATRSEQVIFLSQDTEVVGDYLDVVRSRVSASFMVRHRELATGFGLNTVRPGEYFEEV